MAIISYAKTTNEYRSGIKTETRRDWSLRQYMMWVNFWNTYRLVHDGYDKLPRNGGKPIGKFRLTDRPFQQQLKDMTAENLIAEGGMCKTVDEFCKFINLKPEHFVTVITFKKI